MRTLLGRFKSLLERRQNPAPDGQDKMSRRAPGVKEERHAGAEARKSLPAFFIVGRAKSGTSWLRSIMDVHPDILCVNEGRFFGRSYRGRGAISRSLYGALADSEHLATWVKKSPWSRNGDADRHLQNLTRRVIDYFLAEKLAQVGKTFAGDKTPLTSTEVLAEISEIYPEAKVIHILRDGRDVAVSSMHHLWNNAKDMGGPIDLRQDAREKRDAYRRDPEAFLASGEGIFAKGQLEITAETWADLVGKAMQDGRSLLGANYIEVRYEDLLARPEEETGRLLEFLGADDDPEIVAECVRRTSFKEVSKRERGQEDSASFYRKGVAGDWKDVFTESDKRIFKKIAGDLLVDLGYEKDKDW